MANDAPPSRACEAYAFPLKCGPFRAKKTLSGLIFLESVDTAGCCLNRLYRSSVFTHSDQLPPSRLGFFKLFSSALRSAQVSRFPHTDHGTTETDGCRGRILSQIPPGAGSQPVGPIVPRTALVNT